MKCGWSDHPRQDAGSEAAPKRYRSDASTETPPYSSDPEAPFDAPSPNRQGVSTRQDRRVLSLILHGSLFFSSTGASLILPIVLLIVSKDWVTKSNAKEVLNFQISLFLYALMTFGFVILFNSASWTYLLIPVLIMMFVLPVLAIIHSIQDPDNPYIYPFIIHVLT